MSNNTYEYSASQTAGLFLVVVGFAEGIVVFLGEWTFWNAFGKLVGILFCALGVTIGAVLVGDEDKRAERFDTLVTLFEDFVKGVMALARIFFGAAKEAFEARKRKSS